jgi:hypothetical protein
VPECGGNSQIIRLKAEVLLLLRFANAPMPPELTSEAGEADLNRTITAAASVCFE